MKINLLQCQESNTLVSTLSNPNFVGGRSFANILILACRIELLNTSCHAIQKVFQCFGKEYEKYPRRRVKGSFGGFFRPMGPLENLGVK